jgi:hypothetical protein
MASAGSKKGVYTLGTFDAQNPNQSQLNAMAQAAGTLAASGFDLIVLASMHVHDDGSIYFNDTPMIENGQVTGQLAPDLAQYLQTVKDGAHATILASFGGGGTFNGNAVGFWDFTCIDTLISKYPNPAGNPFFQNLTCLFSSYPIDGFDIDLESYSGYDSFTGTLVAVVQWLTVNGHGATLCPYDAPDFWCEIVKRTQSGGTPSVTWVNLQNAGTTLKSFVAQLEAVGIGTDAISGGTQVGSETPAVVEEYYSGLAQGGLTSGWLWNLESIGIANAKSYAEAVTAGLGS